MNFVKKYTSSKLVVKGFIILFLMLNFSAQSQEIKNLNSVKKITATSYEIIFGNQQKMLIDFYGNHIFRVYFDPLGAEIHPPVAQPPAEILVKNSRGEVEVSMNENEREILFTTPEIRLVFTKETGLFLVQNLKTNVVALQSTVPIDITKSSVKVALEKRAKEYFYGGGVQNGRFSHQNHMIAIENQNSWTDGGVASPKPFYWSTAGYGVLFHTFKKGKYDFGATNEHHVKLVHETSYLDVFFMINETPSALLQDYYQLTGNPVLLPKFAFYEGHLNAYNRDYWKEDSNGILFEDGKRYKESQKDNGGIKESLNGEKNNYQFSARAVIDRYKNNDMPLGWILPNDGYGAGYGQSKTLKGNIKNLKEFGDYARTNGVEIGLWTQSDLHPVDSIPALLQRDIINEIQEAGVRVLKTDVAWVGAGYSFGLNGITEVAHISKKYGYNARPFIITLDGWAGTQRYASIWSGDQTGGKWEYIRFHIPTYIGSGLSGQPNISSDMDGIFGGKNPQVNIRDFQWKTFTPMQLNMDGWGSNPKYPTALNEPATSINRNYLKLKSELIPYTYSIAQNSLKGLPYIRAMFLEEKNAYTLGKSTQYQYMYGPYFLIAPIYQNTNADKEGNDIRNNIYLPKGQWVDYFTGEIYEGGKVINDVEAPLWKLPIFIKNGAIIPMCNPNNNINEIDRNTRIYEVYPYQKSSFTTYDDDGKTEAYIDGAFVKTLITCSQEKSDVTVKIGLAKGEFDGFVKRKSTRFHINVTEKPRTVIARINHKKVKLKEVFSLDEFYQKENVFYYNITPEFNRFSTKGTDFSKVSIARNPQLCINVKPVDVTKSTVSVQIKGFEFQPKNR